MAAAGSPLATSARSTSEYVRRFDVTMWAKRPEADAFRLR